MKKILSAAIVLTILLGAGIPGFAAGSGEPGVGPANPWTVATSGEIERATGLTLVLPDGVEAVCSYTADMAQASWKADGAAVVERVSFRDEAPAMDSDTLTELSGVYFSGRNTQSKELIVGGRCPGYMEFSKGSVGAMMWYDAERGVIYTLSVDPVSDPKIMGDLAETISPLETSAGETCMILIDGCAIAHDLSATPVEEIEDNGDYLWKVLDGYGITYTDADGVVWGIYRAGEAGVFEIVVSSEASPSPWTVGEQIWVGGSKLVELCVADGRLTHILTDELVSGPAFDVTIEDTAASGEPSGEPSGEASR